MATMRAAQFSSEGADLAVVDVDRPVPAPGEVLVRVEACGVCHSDAFAQAGAMGGGFPITPGHEIAGRVEEVTDGVHGFAKGDRVGVGWFGGACGHCEGCRAGDHVNCENLRIPGITEDGGYAEFVAAPADALARIPDELDAADAAPLLCAGITTYNALRNSVAEAGDVVAILGVGGLGHLGVQYAARMGFQVVAIARGAEKAEHAKELGAHVYLDSTEVDVAEELLKLGGAKVVLATVTAPAAMAATLGGLARRGQLIVAGASPEPIEVPPFALIQGSKSVVGTASGTSQDSEDTLGFSALSGVRAQIETVPLEEAPRAFAKMTAGEARFRMVVTVGD